MLPLLATQLSLGEIARLLGLPRESVLADTVAVYRKLGLTPRREHGLRVVGQNFASG